MGHYSTRRTPDSGRHPDDSVEMLILSAVQTLVEVKVSISALDIVGAKAQGAPLRDLMVRQIDETLDLIDDNFLLPRGIHVHVRDESTDASRSE